MSFSQTTFWRRYVPWAALLAAAVGGAALRFALLEHSYPRRFSYFIESCFRFRYAEMRMLDIEPPVLDRFAQWPEGFATDKMILTLPDRVAALFYKLRPGDTFAAARALIITFSAVSVLAFVPLALAALRRPWPAAGATIVFAGTFAALNRSIGNFLREDFAWPGLLIATGATLYILTADPGRRRWPAAGASAVATLWAGSCWHMSQFYVAIIASLIIAYSIAGRGRRAALAGGALWLGLTAAAVLNKPLWSKGALWNVTAAATLAPAAAWVAAKALRQESAVRWFAVGTTIVLVGIPLLLGRSADYGHAYGLLWAKIIHLGRYPGPARLSPQTRLLWVGPYGSPPFMQIMFEYGLLIVPTAAGLILWFYDIARRRLRGGQFVAAATLISAVLYLLMERLTIFLAPWVAVLSVYPAARASRRRWRITALILIAAMWGLHLFTSNTPLGMKKYYQAVQTLGAPEVEVPTYYGTERAHLMMWMRMAPPGAVLTDFSLSSFFLYRAGLPIALHPMFEVTEVRDKALTFARAALEDEETFFELCRRWRIRYVIHHAPQVLSRAPGSFYLATGVEPGPNSAASLMQFHPERLRRFRLIFESYTVRVFEVGLPYDGFRSRAYHPLYDPNRFPAIPSEEDLLNFYRDFYRANNNFAQGLVRQESGDYVAAAAAFATALRLHPDYEDANLRLGQCQAALGQYDEARRAFERAAVATPGDPRPREHLKALRGQRKLTR